MRFWTKSTPDRLPFRRYAGLYTLHQVEQVTISTGALLLTRVRLETLRYSFAPLDDLPLDEAYADDPREGIILLREHVLPRLYTLLDSDDPFGTLGLWGPLSPAWIAYAEARDLPALPAPVVEPSEAERLDPQTLLRPVRSLNRMRQVARPLAAGRAGLAGRLARMNQTLRLINNAADTAVALAALWQRWQQHRSQQQLLDDQRVLLQDAIAAQVRGQDDALDGARERPFVRRYLDQRGDDAAYDGLLGHPLA